jgi:hypothetical protein
MTYLSVTNVFALLPTARESRSDASAVSLSS